MRVLTELLVMRTTSPTPISSLSGTKPLLVYLTWRVLAWVTAGNNNDVNVHARRVSAKTLSFIDKIVPNYV